MKCKRCGDEIQFQPDRQYWAGLHTGGECPAAPVTEQELTDTVNVLDNGHIPSDEADPAAAVVGEPAAVQEALDEQERAWERAREPHPDTAPVEVAEPAAAGEHTCNEENCTTQMRDWARVALQSMTGTMIVEVPLCDLHLGTIEISNTGQYMYLKARR